MTTRILAVLNQKGGVGKTTTCVNLGAALARRGKRVLLVDMDPQANLTVHVGLEPPRLPRTTYSLLLGQHGLAEAINQTGVPGLSVVPSTLALANAEIQLASTVGRELVLREALEEWLHPQDEGDQLPFAGGTVPSGSASEHASSADGSTTGRADDPAATDPGEADGPSADFVLIDCPPSLGTLTMNALCAAGEVLLPIQTEFFALQGVAGILESIKAVQRLNRALRLSMVVPSMVDRRTTLARDVIHEVRAYFPELTTRTEIRKNVKLAEAPSHGKTIFEWDPRCNGALDYDALAAEVLGEFPDEPDGHASEDVSEDVPEEVVEDIAEDAAEIASDEPPAPSSGKADQEAAERPAFSSPEEDWEAAERPALLSPERDREAAERPALLSPERDREAAERPASGISRPGAFAEPEAVPPPVAAPGAATPEGEPSVSRADLPARSNEPEPRFDADRVSPPPASRSPDSTARSLDPAPRPTERAERAERVIESVTPEPAAAVQQPAVKQPAINQAEATGSDAPSTASESTRAREAREARARPWWRTFGRS